MSDAGLETLDDEQVLAVARKQNDPLALAMAYGELGNFYGKQGNYQTALKHYIQARTLFRQLAGQEAALAYTDARIENMKTWIGEDFFKALPPMIAASTIAVWTNDGASRPPGVSLPPTEEFRTSIRYATAVVNQQLGSDSLQELLVSNEEAIDDLTLFKAVGDVVRRHLDKSARDPGDLFEAARFVNQVDRVRRSRFLAAHSQKTQATAGPSGGGMGHHVLYLRSFVASPKLPTSHVDPWGQVDFEEFLACRLDGSPLVAVGDIDLQAFGPGCVTTSDSEWQYVMRKLALEAQMILVVPSVTEGTSWEMEWVAANKFLHKTIFLMPPPGAGYEAWWADNWGRLRRWAVHLGLHVPEYTEHGLLIRLGAERQMDSIELSCLYELGRDLHIALLTNLLFKTNISLDFLFDLQRAAGQLVEEEASQVADAVTVASGPTSAAPLPGEISPEILAALTELEGAPRQDYSDILNNIAALPELPAVFAIWEGRSVWLMFAGATSNLAQSIQRHAEGQLGDDGFTRQLWQETLFSKLDDDLASQLLNHETTIEQVVSFKVRQAYSFSYVLVDNEKVRIGVLDLVWNGALNQETPKLMRPLPAN